MDAQYDFPDFKDHTKTRSMWIGSDVCSLNDYYMVEENKIIKKTANISEALYKIFDEILVNAMDQYFNANDVTKIWVNYNNGLIEVKNNGKGFSIYKVDKFDKYSVELLISREYSGGNFKDKENPDRVTGGVNGLGIKVVNIRSKKFEIETVDPINKLIFSQKFSDGMNLIEPAIVKSYKDSSYTLIRFMPDYESLCKETKGNNNNNWINKENLETFGKIIEFRTYQACSFINSINYRYDKETRIDYKGIEMYFNNKKIKINGLKDFMSLMGFEKIIEFKMESPEIRFPWSVCLGFEKMVGNMSLINGLTVNDGSHINCLYKIITKEFNQEIDKLAKISEEKKISMFKKMVFMIDARQIPIPQFNSQTKESLKLSTIEINNIKKQYNISKTISDKIWKQVKEIYEYKLLNEELKNSNKKKKIKIRKYYKADETGKNSSLIISEGDSATIFIKDVITHKKSGISKKNYGIYNIQGVPPNTCKKTKEIIIDGEVKIKQDPDFQENVAIQGMAQILGLDYTMDYYYGPDKEKLKQGNKQYETLNYGHILIATDQDIDGIGNICSLIIVYILTFWPNLIKRGFIKRLQTPIIRIYAEEVIEFYSEKDFNNWVIKNFGSEHNLPKKYEVKYYKGLSKHSKEELLNIAENISENIINITWDDACKERMIVYYGTETWDRKTELLNPIIETYTDNMYKTQTIPITTHFNIETKNFQINFIERKLKCFVDGLIPSQRKALCAARISIRDTKSIMVYQLTGDVTKRMHYGHGDKSMNDTIIKMSQTYTGSNFIPCFIPIANGFGSRVNSRGKTGSPRYIDLKYNKAMDIMFPKEDDWILDYNYEDGQRCEPKYYVPIIPYSILETSTTPAAGWKIDVWARDFEYTIKLLKNMIEYDYPNTKITTNKEYIVGEPYGFLGNIQLYPNMECRIINGTEYIFGSYYQNGDNIIITQLPTRIWSNKFQEKFIENPDIKDILDNTGNDINEIIVKFKPDVINNINQNYGSNYKTPIEDYLDLYQICYKNINMININNSIKEFENYEDVMKEWFIIRKELYKKRIERQTILLELEILFNSEVLRFIEMDSNEEINIDNKTKEQRDEILESFGFIKFNKTLLNNPKYTKVEEIKKMILEINADYDYIDDINKRMTRKSEIIKLEEKINKLKQELEKLRNSDWKSIWLNELDILINIVRENRDIKWIKTKNLKFKSFLKS